MPTSAPGSSSRPPRGFTLIELMVVLAVIAVGVAVVALAVRDPAATRLEREAQRLAALLEMARAESRTTGVPAYWVPAQPGEGGAAFRFVGLRAGNRLPEGWLDAATTARADDPRGVVLGPDAILPPQRIVLMLEGRQLAVASDGLGAFVAAPLQEAAP